MWSENSPCAVVAPHPNWWAQWNEVIPGFPAFDARTYVPSLEVPYLAISGTADWICSAALVVEYEKTLSAPSTGIVMIEGAGHYTHLDAPERFQDAVLEFAQQNGILATD